MFLCSQRKAKSGNFQFCFLSQVVGKLMAKEKKGKMPMKDVELPKHNMYVFTRWGKWSPCSKCDARGIQKRFGVCHVDVRENHIFFHPVECCLLNFSPVQ